MLKPKVRRQTFFQRGGVSARGIFGFPGGQSPDIWAFVWSKRKIGELEEGQPTP